VIEQPDCEILEALAGVRFADLADQLRGAFGFR
jgi:hypothetical protein